MKLLIIGKEGRMAHYSAPEDYAPYEISYVPAFSTDEEVLAAGRDADLILVDAMAAVTANVMAQMPNLKMIHSEGVGYNFVDVEEARKRHIYVCNCKGMNASAVAEHAIMLMQGLLRDITGGDHAVRTGGQIKKKEGYMINGSLKELGDCTVGLVGFGDIAKETAKYAEVFGAKVVYWNRSPVPEEQRCGAEPMELGELLAVSDIVSLHTAVTPETRHIANEAFFKQMKQGAYLVNTARGELVCGEDLLEAIRCGRLAGAGLDCIEGEPVQLDNPYLQAEPAVAEKIIYSPHIAGITASSFRRGYTMVWQDFAQFSRGEIPNRWVNRW